jgi:phosphohistidine phosphatase
MRVVRLYLVHHGDAVGPEIDPQRPLSTVGRASVDFLATKAASRGVDPAVIWHSGKLRARQTAEAFWRACNPLAEFSATRDLQPGDPPSWMRDRLTGESRDILIAGHFPHLPRLLALLLGQAEASAPEFPQHGMVALVSDPEGRQWTEEWRLA